MAGTKDNIVLIGFMGCGKTTIGTKVADLLDYEFVDTDSMIEEKMEMSISDIFSQYGEDYFRDLETKLLIELNQTLHHAVLSCGGGLPLREENSKYLLSLGFVCFLQIDKEHVIKRLQGDTKRPLLQGPNVEERVEHLLQERTPKYEKSCHVVIRVEDESIEQVSRHVIEKYKNN